MTLERINPDGLARPSGFSHAVRATGTVTVHLAGQTGMDAEGRIVGGGVVGQFEQALGNLLSALRAAGGGPEQLAPVTVHLVDVPGYRGRPRGHRHARGRPRGPDYPAPGRGGGPRP